MRRLRTLWRALRGRCLSCGGRRRREWEASRDFFVTVNPLRCRECNKRYMHAQNYGMSKGRFSGL